MEQIKEFIRSLLVFSKKERQKRKALRKEFVRNIRTGKSALSKERSAQLLNILHVKIAERTSSRSEREAISGTEAFEPILSDSTETVFKSGTTERRSGALLATGWFKWSAAAAILLLAGSFWKYYHPVHSPATAQAPAAGPSSGMTVKMNNSDHILSLSLPDNSVVQLSPGSSLRYPVSFEPGHRHIYLSGMAVFEVARETGRPFTVYAGDINTTALGTRFMMSTLIPGKVQVRLLEGKVVVQPSDRTPAFKDVYLLPGQQLVIDRQLNQFTVTEYKDSTGMTAGARKKTTISTSPQGHSINTSILEFNQEPLTSVLKKIGIQYGVVFRLNGHGFNTMQVTGKFLPSDSLQSVLSMLGAINGLSFTENNDTIVVARIQ